MSMAYADADSIICPTPFQASAFPIAFRERALVIHEGIDTDRIRRVPDAKLKVGDREIDGSTPIVTFINRVFEPMRGFHTMMRALPAGIASVKGLTEAKGATSSRAVYDRKRGS